MIAAFAALAVAVSAPTVQTTDGRTLYAMHCASCHGANLEGTANAPALGGVAAGAVDFQLTTGRMPKQEPRSQNERQPPHFTSAQIDALVSYVTSVSHGPTALPRVPVVGDVARGKAAFIADCAACHGAAARGDSVGFGWVAPALGDATPLQIAEAVRYGPAVMPRFGTAAISDARLADIVAYVESLRSTRPDPGGFDLGYLGPIAEGAVAWILGLGAILLFVKRIGTDD